MLLRVSRDMKHEFSLMAEIYPSMSALFTEAVNKIERIERPSSTFSETYFVNKCSDSSRRFKTFYPATFKTFFINNDNFTFQFTFQS